MKIFKHVQNYNFHCFASLVSPSSWSLLHPSHGLSLVNISGHRHSLLLCHIATMALYVSAMINPAFEPGAGFDQLESGKARSTTESPVQPVLSPGSPALVAHLGLLPLAALRVPLSFASWFSACQAWTGFTNTRKPLVDAQMFSCISLCIGSISTL